MIVVDSSVWIDHFRSICNAWSAYPGRLLPAPGAGILVGDVILFEVVSGYRPSPAHEAVRRALFSFPIVAIVGIASMDLALDHHRRLRDHGFTLGLVDTFIGTCCLIHGHQLLSRDSDFLTMRDHLGLRLVDPLPPLTA